jgi:hypothetical protein
MQSRLAVSETALRFLRTQSRLAVSETALRFLRMQSRLAVTATALRFLEPSLTPCSVERRMVSLV